MPKVAAPFEHLVKFDVMRRTFVFLLFALALGGCKKAPEPVIVNYSISTDIQVPANLLIADQNQLDPVAVATITDSIITANEVSADMIKSILIDSIYVTKSDTLGTSLDFLRELNIQLEGGTESKLLVGTSGELPATLNDTIGLAATTRDIQDFLLGDSAMVWPEIITDQSVLTATNVRVIFDLTFESDSD